jgi:acyl-CoA synthetase (AMP-forming)/AMP-acid ligase II
VIELIERASAAVGDAIAVITPRGSTTYPELASRARAIAGGLREQGIERFGVLLEDPAEVLAVLAGASAAGFEACVYPLAASVDDVAALCERLDHTSLITDRDVPEGVRRVSVNELVIDDNSDSSTPLPERRPHLILTTGTTGHPRAAMHDWTNLLERSATIRPTPDQRWLLAYALNQFGGLQVAIHVFTAHAMLVAAESFRPTHGLQAVREHELTHVSGTPTFWRFLLAEMRAAGIQLPRLQQVTLGGEAVPDALLDQLQAAFPTAKISQIYGATEFGQNMTVRDGRSGLPVDGIAGSGLEFKVVDDELWVRSTTMMSGYYGEEPIPEGWRPTGDLVEIVGDRIEFRGRRSEIINVGGVKVHPFAVENVVSPVPGVALARVFGRKNALVGSIVAIEVLPEPGSDHDKIADAIRQACSDLPPAARPRSIRFVEDMQTSGNKLRRGNE